jgi:surface antigen
MKTVAIRITKIAALASLIAVAGAQQSRADQTDLLGTLIGGGLGALAGSQFGSGTGKVAATAGGAVLGALLGNAFTNSNLFGGRDDYGAYRPSGYQPAPTYAPAYVPPPPPQPTYQPAYQPAYQPTYQPAYRPAYTTAYAGHGDYCRDYESTVYINGRPQRSHGLACYQPDGSWRIVQ